MTTTTGGAARVLQWLEIYQQTEWPDPICVTYLDSGAFIEINPAFTQTFGWTAAEVIDQSAEQIGLWDDSSKRLQRIEQVIREQALSNVAIVVHHKTGQSLTCVISSRLIKVGDQPCIVTTLRDITQQQRPTKPTGQSLRNGTRRGSQSANLTLRIYRDHL